MKRRQQEQKGKKPRKKTEPLAEGIQKGRRPSGFFTKMSDDELVDYARGVLEEKGLKRRGELSKTDPRLYEVLRKRKLLDRIDFEEKQRNWASMSDDQLVDYALRVVKEKNLTKRKKLEEADGGLYNVLRKRNLLDTVIRESLHSGKIKREARNWTVMTDDEIVEYARRVVDEKGANGRKDLQDTDSGLYAVLLKRKLLDRVIPNSAHTKRKQSRDWASMSDDQLVDYALRFLDKKNLNKRNALQTADCGLYGALRKKRLLDAVFAPIETLGKMEAVQQVVDAMKEFDSS